MMISISFQKKYATLIFLAAITAFSGCSNEQTTTPVNCNSGQNGYVSGISIAGSPGPVAAGNRKVTLDFKLCPVSLNKALGLAVYRNGGWTRNYYLDNSYPQSGQKEYVVNFTETPGSYIVKARLWNSYPGDTNPGSNWFGESQEVSLVFLDAGVVLLVSKAREYLSGNRSFFIPPGIEGSTGSERNASGAVCWANQDMIARTGTGTPTQESRAGYNEKIQYATKSNQTHWNQYGVPPIDSRAGWPQSLNYPWGGPNVAGFVCYVLVGRAANDAGYAINPDLARSCDYFAQFSEVTGAVQVGDIVLYEFDRDNSFDHVGVITDVTSANQRYYKVISSIGILEIFNYGAGEKRLGVFGTTISGGDFSRWRSAWENYQIRIVRLP